MSTDARTLVPPTPAATEGAPSRPLRVLRLYAICAVGATVVAAIAPWLWHRGDAPHRPTMVLDRVLGNWLWWDGEWYLRERALSGMAEALLGIAGELYLPFLVANAQAFAKGLERLEISVWGLPYVLSPFKYQVKCLDLIREKFAALNAEHRAALRSVLERTGCWKHLDAK